MELIGREMVIQSRFYFTGGTALSEVYLQHRESVDLDFFSETRYDPQTILTVIATWSKRLGFSFESQFVDPTHIYIFSFKNGEKLKVDFAFYPYKRLEKGPMYQGMETDSKLDIAVNKLLLVTSQRTEVKDFVDLYFLLQELSLWDLIEGVRVKFGSTVEPYILASDLLSVEEFEFLPKMLKPLNLSELKSYFLTQAKELGKKAVA